MYGLLHGMKIGGGGKGRSNVVTSAEVYSREDTTSHAVRHKMTSVEWLMEESGS